MPTAKNPLPRRSPRTRTTQRGSNSEKRPDDRLKVHNHVLTGPGASYVETPNKGGVIEPKFLVFHYTAGRSAQASIDWMTNPEAGVSAHIVIARNGSITQLAPFNIKTWHAGQSFWDGFTGLNRYSIGIEMDNAGPLTMVGDKLQAWFGKVYPKNQAIHAPHKFKQEPQWWHAYTEIQITRAIELAKLLMKSYNLREVVGHEDIAPERKQDPGPAFPLSHIQALVRGRSEEEFDSYRVTASQLNIRTGPGTEFSHVTTPLPQRTLVRILERRDRWSKVAVQDEEAQQGRDIEGWVYNTYIQRA